MLIRTVENDSGRGCEGVLMPRSVPSSLRENLIRLRAARGWTQADLARRAGIPQSSVSRLESGSHASGRWSTIEAIASALGVDAAELTGETMPTAAPAPAATAPAVGRIGIGEILPAYISSEWFIRDAPTPDEMRWLAGLGMITWTGAPPQPGTIHVLLEERRKGRI